MLRSSRWWARELARREQAWAEERRQLIDRICHLAGHPWTPPPIDTNTAGRAADAEAAFEAWRERRLEMRPAPEQFPLDD